MHMARARDNLVLADEASWGPSEEHPDLDALNEARKLEQAFEAAWMLESTRNADEDFRAWMRDSLHESRNLVAELRPEQTEYVDTDVKVPAVYVYAVVGLDARGDVVARSRPALAVLFPGHHIDHFRLACAVRYPTVDTALSVRPDIAPPPAPGPRTQTWPSGSPWSSTAFSAPSTPASGCPSGTAAGPTQAAVPRSVMRACTTGRSA